MEVLSNWLTPTIGRLVRVHLARVDRPWGVSLGNRDTVLLRVMLRGGCWVRAAGFEPFEFQEGDVLISRGLPHELLSRLNQPTQPVEIFNHNLLVGNGPKDDEFICGAFGTEFAHSAIPPLPPFMLIRSEEICASPRFASILTAVREECKAPHSDRDAMMSLLMEALFLCAMRVSARHYGEGLPIASIRNPAVVKAIQLLQDNVSRRWTVELLAKRVGLSRAIFAKRFVQELGTPPLAFLTSWRMRLAARYLTTNNHGLAQIAASVGYVSASAFSRTFKREFGVAPDEFRRLGRLTLKEVGEISDLSIVADRERTEARFSPFRDCARR